MIKTFMAKCWDLINKAKQQGATVNEIASIFKEIGCPVSEKTFTSYYQELRRASSVKRHSLARRWDKQFAV